MSDLRKADELPVVSQRRGSAENIRQLWLAGKKREEYWGNAQFVLPPYTP